MNAETAGNILTNGSLDESVATRTTIKVKKALKEKNNLIETTKEYLSDRKNKIHSCLVTYEKLNYYQKLKDHLVIETIKMYLKGVTI